MEGIGEAEGGVLEGEISLWWERKEVRCEEAVWCNDDGVGDVM